jgi:hypothetical protein
MKIVFGRFAGPGRSLNPERRLLGHDRTERSMEDTPKAKQGRYGSRDIILVGTTHTRCVWKGRLCGHAPGRFRVCPLWAP